MTWMPASTWTPPTATSSSPSSSSSRRSLAAWNGASPSWRTTPNRAAHRGCPASSPGPARNPRPPSSPGSPGPMAFPVDGWPLPTGWSTRWRAAPIAGPRCPAAGPIAPREVEPRVPAQVTEHVFIARVCPRCGATLPQASSTGQPWEAAPGLLRQPDRHPAGGGEGPSAASNGICERPPVAPQRGRHRRGMAQQARPAVSGIFNSSPVHADETGWREDGANWTFSTPTAHFLRLAPSRWWMNSATGSRLRFLWPTTITTAPSGAGPTLRDIHDPGPLPR